MCTLIDAGRTESGRPAAPFDDGLNRTSMQGRSDLRLVFSLSCERKLGAPARCIFIIRALALALLAAGIDSEPVPFGHTELG